ncbi:MAG: hypothetical protein QOE33_1870 [Acidobacteriota bacterium]|nr:hypothetical protein [Acidobacteriota bacterium]
MDWINKTLGAVTALVILLTGLVTALRVLITKLRELRQALFNTKHPSSDNIVGILPNADLTGRHTLGETLSSTLLRSRTFVVGLLLFIAGAAGIAYLYYHTTQLSVEVTQPKSGTLSVKSDGKGSGEYPVTGNYNGRDLAAKNLQIYVLVRSEDAGSNEPWYVQGTVEIVREDTWYRKGEWRLSAASVGRGETDNPLKRGEKWGVMAVIAPQGLSEGSAITPAQLGSEGQFQAKSEISHVVVGDIAPKSARLTTGGEPDN